MSPPTARDYVELLAEAFMLLTLFVWDTSGRGLSARKRRKVYFIDPLLGRVGPHLVPGSPAPAAHAVRENLVAIALYRASTERLVQADPVTGSLCFWRSGRGTELDFLISEEAPGIRGTRLPIEVKGDAARSIANARRSIGQAFGRGLVLTSSLLDLEHEIPAVPASLFVAALRERTERKPIAV